MKLIRKPNLFKCTATNEIRHEAQLEWEAERKRIWKTFCDAIFDIHIQNAMKMWCVNNDITLFLFLLRFSFPFFLFEMSLYFKNRSSFQWISNNKKREEENRVCTKQCIISTYLLNNNSRKCNRRWQRHIILWFSVYMPKQ